MEELKAMETKAIINVILGFSNSSMIVKRIKGIENVHVLEQVTERSEALNRTLELKPDVLIVSNALEGSTEWSILVSNIPPEIRILMIPETEMNILVKDKLEECGVEFITDLSVAALEKMISCPDSVEIEEEETKEGKPDTSGEYREAARRIRGRMSGMLKVAQNAAQSKISSMTDAAKNTIKNIPSVQLPKPQIKPQAPEGRIKNVVAVKSQAGATGKSFIAGNLGVILAELGYSTCIVDFSENRSIHTAFKLPVTEDSLKLALETGKFDSAPYEHKKYQGLYIYSYSPDEKALELDKMDLKKFIAGISSRYDFVLIDAAKTVSEGINKICGCILEINDMDMVHWQLEDGENDILIINKFSEEIGIEPAVAKGVKDLFYIPMAHGSAMKSIYTGVPAVTFDPGLSASFLKLAEFLESEAS